MCDGARVWKPHAAAGPSCRPPPSVPCPCPASPPRSPCAALLVGLPVDLDFSNPGSWIRTAVTSATSQATLHLEMQQVVGVVGVGVGHMQQSTVHVVAPCKHLRPLACPWRSGRYACPTYHTITRAWPTRPPHQPATPHPIPPHPILALGPHQSTRIAMHRRADRVLRELAGGAHAGQEWADGWTHGCIGSLKGAPKTCMHHPARHASQGASGPLACAWADRCVATCMQRASMWSVRHGRAYAKAWHYRHRHYRQYRCTCVAIVNMTQATHVPWPAWHHSEGTNWLWQCTPLGVMVNAICVKDM